MPQQRYTPGLKPPVGDTHDPDSLYYWLLRYLANRTERFYSPRTLENMDYNGRLFISWAELRGITRPGQVNRPMLEAFRRYLFLYRKKSGNPLSVRAQVMRLSMVRGWFGWMTREQAIPANPASELELPRVGHRLPRAVLTAREAELILAQPDLDTPLGIRDRAILETFYSTGMRRTELTNLEPVDLDFDRGAVMIRQGKGGKDRLIPIGERALLWIAKYRDDVRPGFVAGRDGGLLFLTQWGAPMRPDLLTHRIADYVDDAKLGKRGSCHMFRHTMATLMLENGADLRHIQAMLGHAKLDTTSLYTHLSLRALKVIHSATHPGKLPERVAELAAPTVEDLLSALEREAEEDGE